MKRPPDVLVGLAGVGIAAFMALAFHHARQPASAQRLAAMRQDACIDGAITRMAGNAVVSNEFLLLVQDACAQPDKRKR